MKQYLYLTAVICALLPLAAPALHAQQYSRAPGDYPGSPAEYTGPSLRAGGAASRNLALHRPAYHSSSYDYNLTAQLVTDGIKQAAAPRWVAVSTSDGGELPINEREMLFDENFGTAIDVKGKRAWVQIQMGGGDSAPAVDRVDVDASVRPSAPVAADWQNWTLVLSGSGDGKAWRELKRMDGASRPSGELKASLKLASATRSRFLRIEFLCGRDLVWHLGEIGLVYQDRPVRIAGPWGFSSAWMSAAAGEQWVYVDLGAGSTFDRVVLYWIRRTTAGAIQVSEDASTWNTLQALPAKGATDDIRLAHPATGRYVRVLMTAGASAEPYILSELEVYGHGGLVPASKPAPTAGSGGLLPLAGGAWRVERDSLVRADGPAISTVGFQDRDWVVATVPGTVLASYLNAGAIPDPNFGDNQFMISESFFYADFWYRDEFEAPPAAAGRRQWLNFDGINWKANVFLNGKSLGRIEGAFQRARFDVTGLVKPGKNALAVRIEKNHTPGILKAKTFDSTGINGGALGADNPTFHASVGWDWIPTIHGRNTGIWNNVYLSASGPVTVENPFVRSTLPLPDTSRADIAVEVTLRNHDAQPVSGVLRGRFGETAFELPVALEASAEKTVKLDPSTHSQLRLSNPKLWWPNGYGDPNLYAVELSFEAGGQVSDIKRFQTGVRQFTYSEEGGALRMWINGRRFVPRGGNWGFGESMLRYRAREYDAAVRYHRETNFTMIRNWVGQIGEDAFYEACDRYGIVVWQDFWLANPYDGPNPNDDEMFLRNVRDTVLRIRNHPSMGLYCGRNEGYPPLRIEDGLRQAVAGLHPGLHYIPSSADDVVSGHGPYQVMPQKFYFAERATAKLHSELGMPSMVPMDSLRAMMPADSLWPQGSMWGLHDFTAHGAQGGDAFREQIDKNYGGATNVADWVALAQFVTYDGYRAMFEAQGRNRMGLLLWMSHPAWPSLTWQTYDYYLNPGAAYFGSRKGSEPLHIQWNAATDNIEVVNYSGGNQKGLTARVELLNMDGSVRWEKTAAVDSQEDSVVAPVKMEYPSGLTPVQFIRLKLTRGGQTLSENFYWHGAEEANYRALRDLPKVKLEAATRVERRDRRWLLSTDLSNPSSSPALMVTVKAVRETSGDRILPVIYSDNYIALMPGEKRTVTTELEDADTRGERPAIVVEGFNVAGEEKR